MTTRAGTDDATEVAETPEVVRIDSGGAEPALFPVGDAAGEDGDENTPVGFGDRLRRIVTSGESNAPLYPRLLRLQHVHPNGWQRAALVEGMAILGAIAALADRATSWAPLILPIAAAGVVKFHDVLAGALPSRPARDGDAEPEA